MDTAQRTPVPMREAADHLGISVAAVRQPIRRGTLESHKGDDGRWYVRIPAVPDGVPDGVGGPVPLVDHPSSVLIDTLKSENAFLRGEVENRNRELANRTREIQELHILLQTAQQNEQRLLSATVPDAPRATEIVSTPTHTPPEANTPQRGVGRERAASPPAARTWWQRLLGVE